ncbi:COL6A [Mytilus edulis]|uniref:COL6A n=1 Tax=Mytilus edulis TaxID=6550 RepID=A0A8S3V6K4_MYTED|nr:COL6A [Mytilus edulis]
MGRILLMEYVLFYTYEVGEPICNAVADIVFVYDTCSRPIDSAISTNFNKTKEFIINIVNAFNPVGPNGAQFAAHCYSGNVTRLLNFGLTDYGNKSETIVAINRFTPDTNPTDFMSFYKLRETTQCFVIVITDGRPKVDNNITAATEADRLNATETTNVPQVFNETGLLC